MKCRAKRHDFFRALYPLSPHMVAAVRLCANCDKAKLLSIVVHEEGRPAVQMTPKELTQLVRHAIGNSFMRMEKVVVQPPSMGPSEN